VARGVAAAAAARAIVGLLAGVLPERRARSERALVLGAEPLEERVIHTASAACQARGVVRVGGANRGFVRNERFLLDR